MPFKHQANCYRTFNGIRWPNLCDILSEDDQGDVDACRDAGVRLRLRKHADGYHQAFFHPDDNDLVTRTIHARWN